MYIIRRLSYSTTVNGSDTLSVLLLCGSCYPFTVNVCACGPGGIGRHNRLKICRLRSCRFKSGGPHHLLFSLISGTYSGCSSKNVRLTVSKEGRLVCAPDTKHALPAATDAQRIDWYKLSPSDKRAANQPTKQSPAAVVSTGSNSNAGILRVSDLLKAKAPRAPKVRMHVFLVS